MFIVLFLILLLRIIFLSPWQNIPYFSVKILVNESSFHISEISLYYYNLLLFVWA